MKILLAAVVPRRSRSKIEEIDQLLTDYMERVDRYMPCESQLFDSEADLLKGIDRKTNRAAAYVVLLDSRGQQLSSEEFASYLGRLRDGGTQRLVLAIGPADGWSPTARDRANLLFSLGPYHAAAPDLPASFLPSRSIAP